jgi:Family of unknown function (DUF6496)
MAKDPYMGNTVGSNVPGAESSFSALRQKPRTGGGIKGTQSGAAPKTHLDSRMEELDRNLADVKAGKARLTMGPNGKFQFVSVGVSKPAAPKPAAPKPESSSGPTTSSAELMHGFDGLDTAKTSDSNARTPSDLVKGYTGEKGTYMKKGGAIPKGGKVGKVMGEFKSGSLKSSSGQKVTNRRQAMAIAMSEAGKSKMKKFAAGGMSAPAPQNPIGQMKQAANMVNTLKNSAGVQRPMAPDMRTPYPVKRPVTGYGGRPTQVDDSMMRPPPGDGATGYGPIPSKPLDPNFTDAFPKTQSTYSGPTPSDTNRSLFMKKGGKVKKMATGGDLPKLKEPNRKVSAMKRSDAGENPAMVKKEMAFMQKKGAPKSMIKHEMGEAEGMKKGGMACMKRGGGIEKKGYGPVQKFAKGGSIDGCAVRGKTKAAKHRK